MFFWSGLSRKSGFYWVLHDFSRDFFGLDSLENIFVGLVLLVFVAHLVLEVLVEGFVDGVFSRG